MNSTELAERAFAGGWGHNFERKPVAGSCLADLDMRRLIEYAGDILGEDTPEGRDVAGWEELLQHLAFLARPRDCAVATVKGCLLFGLDPRRLLPQSGIRAVCHAGREPGCSVCAEETIGGPLVPLHMVTDAEMEGGLVDQAWDFVRRYTLPSSRFEGTERIDQWGFPEAAVREALVNAVVHRDYSISDADIMLAIFSDRLEVQSPGRLPSTVTPEAMRSGLRFARNQTLVNVMRDYRYVDARGMGVRNRIIPAMKAHNGTEPDLIAEEHRFTVRLWKHGQDDRG